MRDKELRLAIVCSGGISLAVYMHGIVKEILKITRASKHYHAVPDTAEKRRRKLDDIPQPDDRAIDTERVYFEMLQALGEELDLRVIVDVIAGTSAGGINSVILARALAHDLSFEVLRELWLTGADIDALVADDHQAGWSQRVFRPMVQWILGDRLRGVDVDDEVSEKLLSLTQVARLKPPFDGERLIESLIDAMESMGRPVGHEESLIPDGLSLDMVVTVTDFFGYTQSIPLYDPPVIEEREHRHRLHFRYRRWTGGDMETDFEDSCVPALAFAARATASFPGAFPPAQLGEVDRVLARRGRTWKTKPRFLAGNFKPYFETGSDPEKTSFIDGAVLNNNPFGPAIEAIGRQPALRDVDRRLVYINPNPASRPPPPTGNPPGMLRTLRAALSDIPRNEPISDDLLWVQELNERVRLTREIVEAARPDITRAVEEITRSRAEKRHLTVAQVASWRDQANARASEDAGFAFKGYLRLKLDSAATQVGGLVAALCDHRRGSLESEFVIKTIRAWARHRSVVPDPSWAPEPGTLLKDPPSWVKFLRGFDLDFRRRRIRFVIQALNGLYGRLDEPELAELSAYRLDYLKGQFYEVLDALRSREGTATISLEATARARDLFEAALATGQYNSEAADNFALANLGTIDTLIEGLARDLELETMNRRSDEIFAGIEHAGPAGLVRRELLIDYLGFPLWDVMTFSTGSWDPAAEYDEIRVARLSPQDCNALREGGPEAVLQGTKLGNFGAFFKRAHRENDYLWGRLHGVDRLIDIVADVARREDKEHLIDVAALKKKAFQAVIKAERPHLRDSEVLLGELEAEIEALG
ncbi:MAG: patatin-like protein [Alphaproteobacteria bacterium]